MDTASSSASWTRRPERGSLPLVRFMVWLSLALGRTATRPLMWAIATYFFVSSPVPRANIAAFLRRCLGREPRMRDVFASFVAFSTCVHDRVYFVAGRVGLFDVRREGAEQLGSGGSILLGAHVGSFEALHAAGLHIGHRRIAMAMYEENARRLNGLLSAVNPEAMNDIVPLGHVGSMITLGERLEAGDLVGVLSDRTLGDEPVVMVPFLGEPAPFPTGPMRVAAALHQRVFLMMGLYRGGNRYDVIFEPLADFTEVSREDRAALVREAVERYAARLEHYVRMSPENWFNFHDFWGKT